MTGVVRACSPADRAGIVRVDLLRYVYFGDEKVYKIDQSRDIFFILEEKVGIGNSITYTIERALSSGEVYRGDADLRNIEPEPSQLPLQLYLAIVGSIFMMVGVYVLIKHPGAPYSTHFYLIC